MEINGKEYKINFGVIRRIENALKTNESDGFSILIEGLIKRDIDILLNTIKSITKLSDDETITALDPYFSDDKATDQLFDEVLNSFVDNGFLKQKMVTLIKEMKQRLLISDKLMTTFENKTEKLGAEFGVSEMRKTISRLEKITQKN